MVLSLDMGILKDLRKAYDFDLELYPIEIHPEYSREWNAYDLACT